MTSLLEFNARAELCRNLAKLEPHARYIWLAEAERWSRLMREPAVTMNANYQGASAASPHHRAQPRVTPFVTRRLPISAGAGAD